MSMTSWGTSLSQVLHSYVKGAEVPIGKPLTYEQTSDRRQPREVSIAILSCERFNSTYVEVNSTLDLRSGI